MRFFLQILLYINIQSKSPGMDHLHHHLMQAEIRFQRPVPLVYHHPFLWQPLRYFQVSRLQGTHGRLWTKWSRSSCLAPISKDSIQWGKEDWEARKLYCCWVVILLLLNWPISSISFSSPQQCYHTLFYKWKNTYSEIVTWWFTYL